MTRLESVAGFVRNAVRHFFGAQGGPFNLALARIWFFAVLPFLLPRPGQVEAMADLPRSLEFPPHILGWLVADLDLTSGAIRALWVVIIGGCILASVGLFA